MARGIKSVARSKIDDVIRYPETLMSPPYVVSSPPPLATQIWCMNQAWKYDSFFFSLFRLREHGHFHHWLMIIDTMYV